MLIPDRLPSLIYLVGFWIPPAAVGWTAAKLAYQRDPRVRAASTYAVLATFVVAWAAAWFFFQLDSIPPYIPGSTMDPTYAPPKAIAGLLVVTSVLVLPGSAIACVLAFRSHGRALRHTPGAPGPLA
jgi:hypothetical protein